MHHVSHEGGRKDFNCLGICGYNKPNVYQSEFWSPQPQSTENNVIERRRNIFFDSGCHVLRKTLPLPEYNHSSICKKTTTNNSKKKSWERAFDCCHIVAIVKANMRRRWSPCELSLATVSSKHSGPFSARLGALRGHVYGQSGPKQGSRGLHLAFSTLYKRFKLWHGDGIVHRKALPSVCLNGLKKKKICQPCPFWAEVVHEFHVEVFGNVDSQ